MSASGRPRSRRREEAQARAAQRARKAQRQRRAKWISAVALAGLVLLGLAGWAILNGDGDDPEPAASGETVSQEESILAFYQCLRDHGLDVEDPDTSGGGIRMGGPDSDIDFEDPAVQAILEECRGLVDGPMQTGGMGQNPADTDALFNFVACLQDHGIDFPDPEPDGTLVMPENFDPESAEFQAAREACMEHLDGGGIRVQGPGGGGPGSVQRNYDD